MLSVDDCAVRIGSDEIAVILWKRCALRCIGGAFMRRHDKRTREQRKADEAMLFAGICLLLAAVLIAVSAMM